MHNNDLGNTKYTLLDTSNNLKRIIAGGGIIEDSSLNKLEYGVYRFNKLTKNNSPSGLDNDGVLIVLPIIYSSKFCLQIFGDIIQIKYILEYVGMKNIVI